MDIYQKFGTGSLAVAEYKLSRGDVLAKAELAEIIRANPGVALPPPIADHMARWFEGEVKGQRGCKTPGPGALLSDLLALVLYHRYLPWLQCRQRRMGLRNSRILRRWPGPPHERAAQMVAERLGRNQSWRHILNLVSRRGRGRSSS